MNKLAKKSNPHDALFKKIIGSTDLAKDFIQNYLPPEILKHIDLNQLQIKKDTITDEKLKSKYLDLLYQTKTNNKPAYIYLLFEHKSYQDSGVAVQILGCMAATWQLEIEQKVKELSIILPVVVYHGKPQWNTGQKLSDLMAAIPPELKPYLPDYQYLLYDIPRYPAEQIKGEIKLRIFLETLKNTFNPAFISEVLETILSKLSQLEKQDPAASRSFSISIMIYNALIHQLDMKTVEHIYQKTSSGKGELIMNTVEQIREEGIEIGEKRGLEKGATEKQKEIVLNMLKSGLNLAVIQQVTGLSQKEIKQLKQF